MDATISFLLQQWVKGCLVRILGKENSNISVIIVCSLRTPFLFVLWNKHRLFCMFSSDKWMTLVCRARRGIRCTKACRLQWLQAQGPPGKESCDKSGLKNEYIHMRQAGVRQLDAWFSPACGCINTHIAHFMKMKFKFVENNISSPTSLGIKENVSAQYTWEADTFAVLF